MMSRLRANLTLANKTNPGRGGSSPQHGFITPSLLATMPILGLVGAVAYQSASILYDRKISPLLDQTQILLLQEIKHIENTLAQKALALSHAAQAVVEQVFEGLTLLMQTGASLLEEGLQSLMHLNSAAYVASVFGGMHSHSALALLSMLFMVAVAGAWKLRKTANERKVDALIRELKFQGDPKALVAGDEASEPLFILLAPH